MARSVGPRRGGLAVCALAATKGGEDEQGGDDGRFGDAGEELGDVRFAELGFALSEEGGGEGAGELGGDAVDEEVVGAGDGAVVVESAEGPGGGAGGVAFVEEGVVVGGDGAVEVGVAEVGEGDPGRWA